MISRFEKRDVITVIAAIATAAFCIWGIVFMVGEIVKMDQSHLSRIAVENQERTTTEEEVIEESVYDDTTGTYGPMIRPSGKLGMGTDMGGITISPSGQIGIPLF